DALPIWLKKVAGVRDVFSLAELSKTLGEIERTSNPFLKASPQPEVLNTQNEMARRFRDLFTGYTHGSDGRTAALICVLVPEAEAEVARHATIADMRKIMES